MRNLIPKVFFFGGVVRGTKNQHHVMMTVMLCVLDTCP